MDQSRRRRSCRRTKGRGRTREEPAHECDTAKLTRNCRAFAPHTVQKRGAIGRACASVRYLGDIALGAAGGGHEEGGGCGGDREEGEPEAARGTDEVRLDS